MRGEPLLLEGTVRARPPQETWEVIAPQLSRFGITRVADLTGLDYLGLPVATAIRPGSLTLSASQGKGASGLLARLSAVMEAIELWAVEQPLTVVGRGPAREVAPYPLAALPVKAHVRPDLLDQIPLDWTAGTGIRTGRAVPVPCDVVRRSVQRPGWAPDVLRATSTGLACGNTRHEALLHALYEVVERDTLYADEISGGRQRTLIDPATVTDPYARSIVERLLAAHVSLELAVVAGPYGLPVCLAYLWTEDYPLWFAGAGCHSDPHIALTRALTEAAQSRLTCIAGTRDDLPSHEEAFAALPVRPPARQGLRPWGDLVAGYEHPPWRGGFADQVAAVAARIEGVTGYEPVCLDLSAPGEPFAAFQIICPGTRSRIRRSVPR